MDIFNIGKDGKGFIIGIEKTEKLGDVKKINKFLNIVYDGEKTGMDENDTIYKFHQIRFLEGDENLANYLFSMLEDDKKINDSMSFVEIVEYISSLFRNHSTEKTIQKLIGDMGEILFILWLERNNIKWVDAYHKERNSLYDFSFPKWYLDVKTTSKKNKSIYVSLNQLNIDEDIKKERTIKFIIVEIEKIEGQKNIIELIKEIKFHHQVIDDMLIQWQYIYSVEPKFIDSYTANIENKIFILDEESLPEIKIVKKNNMKSGVFEISVAGKEHPILLPFF